MLASALRYVARHPARAMRALATDPAAVLDTMVDRVVQAREYRHGPCVHDSCPDWDAELHRALGTPWPCCDTREFWSLWPRVIAKLKRAGISAGPETFNGFNDGDAALTRAVWCIVRHLRPQHVVETGVAHGLTTRFALEALEHNGSGRLESIDRPPLDAATRKRIGLAVDDRARWNLILGSSRRRLEPVLHRLGAIGLFIHDSLHTEQNVRFELDRAWRHLMPGGAIIVDDIDTNQGFCSFLRDHRVCRSFVCEAEPVRPDGRRFNGKGLFGIILKGCG